MTFLRTVLDVTREFFMLLVVLAICFASLYLIADLLLTCREAML